MNKLWGTSLAAAVLALLAACGSPTTPPPRERLPEAQRAPIETVTGLIPGEAGKFGVLANGHVRMDWVLEFAEPHLHFAFDEDGSFNLPLPTPITGAPLNYEACDFTGHTLVVRLFTMDAEVGSSMPPEELRNEYYIRDARTIGWYWYSPITTRITCVVDDPPSLTGKHEDWDLDLVAGWNQVRAMETEDGGLVARTLPLAGLSWASSSNPR